MTIKTIIDMNDRAVLSGITEDLLKNIKTGCTNNKYFIVNQDTSKDRKIIINLYMLYIQQLAGTI